MGKLLVLDHDQISLKLDRIAWQIIERYYGEKEIILLGLSHRGTDIASKIQTRILKFSDLSVQRGTISLDKSNPLQKHVSIALVTNLERKSVLLVDDVLNSGSTMVAALREVLNHNPLSVRTAVLANRDHHKFPIQANFVGISLATTLKEHISYEEVAGKMSVSLS
jgi:pyrimidine operon attenuation protein/uracil phosphoribosyltransferase